MRSQHSASLSVCRGFEEGRISIDGVEERGREREERDREQEDREREMERKGRRRDGMVAWLLGMYGVI
jgi:hypothetical protein